MVTPTDRARFVETFGMSSAEPKAPIEAEDIARILASENLSLEDVKTLIRGVRYRQGYDEKFEYANSLLGEASDYLRPYELRVFVRAEITESEAAEHLQYNKAFFGRLAGLLPSIVEFFSKAGRLKKPIGIVRCIDDCHNDFYRTAASPRRDRQIREAKEKLTRAARLAAEAASALEEVHQNMQHEFTHYRAVYYRPAAGPRRFLSDLVGELRMCAGVADIAYATTDIEPRRVWLFGNDQRTAVVEEAYHMSLDYDGPKLVTTPGSDFATLCSLLFEAVSGKSDEGLAGAINRYARSEARKQWDKSGEDDDPDDNFQTEKAEMARALHAIQLCKKILETPVLSDKALDLLNMRIKKEEQRHEEALTRHGPRQVYLSQMNQQQWEDMLSEAVAGFRPEQIERLDEMIRTGKTMAADDIRPEKARRSALES